MKEKKSKLYLGILYLCVHRKFIERYGLNEIDRKFLFRMLGETFHVPKNLRDAVITEMQKLGMVEKVNRDMIKILPMLSDPEENPGKFFMQLGLF